MKMSISVVISQFLAQFALVCLIESWNTGKMAIVTCKMIFVLFLSVLTYLHWNKEVLEKRSLILRGFKSYPTITGTRAQARFFSTLKFAKI